MLTSTQRLDGYDFKLIDGCRKYLGKYPYDTDTNIVASDAIFLNRLVRCYGAQNVAYVLMVLKREDS